MQSEFEHLWREFARGDANVTAPARLRHAVMSAWDTAQGEPVSSRGRPRAVRLALAAGLVAVTVLTVVTVRERETTVRESVPLIPLVADPVFQNEPLTLVRLRMPRTSLAAIGITFTEPETASLVDVDIVVSSDGLPRSIQRIQPAVDARFD
jgi:hypothetical protein